MWILLVSVILFIALTLNAMFWINLDNSINVWGFYILFLSLFSYWLLKNKLYKHHYFSIIIIALVGLLYNIFANKFDNERIKKYYVVYLMNVLNAIFFSFYFVLDKYYMLIKYIKPYEILFFQGLIVLVLSIITLIITTKIGYIDNL